MNVNEYSIHEDMPRCLISNCVCIVFTVSCPFKPEANPVKKYVFVPIILDVRAQNRSINRIPPAMRTFDDNVEIVRIIMHVVFATIVANNITEAILLLSGNCVLGC